MCPVQPPQLLRFLFAVSVRWYFLPFWGLFSTSHAILLHTWRQVTNCNLQHLCQMPHLPVCFTSKGAFDYTSKTDCSKPIRFRMYHLFLPVLMKLTHYSGPLVMNIDIVPPEAAGPSFPLLGCLDLTCCSTSWQASKATLVHTMTDLQRTDPVTDLG